MLSSSVETLRENSSSLTEGLFPIWIYYMTTLKNGGFYWTKLALTAHTIYVFLWRMQSETCSPAVMAVLLKSIIMVVLNQARFDVIKLGPVLHRHTMSCSVLVFHTENSESFLSPHKELREPANFYKGKKPSKWGLSNWWMAICNNSSRDNMQFVWAVVQP